MPFDVLDNKSHSSLKSITIDFADHLVQTNVAAFSNCIDFNCCCDGCSEEEYQ